MVKRHLSGFAQFPNNEMRAKFVNAVLASEAALSDHAYLSGSAPTIVFENLTDDEQEKVVSALEGVGRWVEDVRFELLR